jgi:hypothetical protein
MTESMFTRLTRYGQRTANDPRENRLTAAFAEMLRRNEDLARALASGWIADVGNGPVDVRIQQAGSSGIIDIALRFGDPGYPDVLLWVEVKHGAGPSGVTQFAKYRDELRASASARRRELLVLAPASFNAAAYDLVKVGTEDGRGTVLWTSWQDTYATLSNWETDDPVGRWLIDEFLLYMEEEGLAERAITTNDVEALRRLVEIAEADAAIERVQRRAGDLIATAWGSPTKRPRYELDSWVIHACAPAGEAAPPAWSESDFRWGWESPGEPGEAPTFWAGASCGPEGPLNDSTHEPWISGMEAEGFLPWHDRHEHWLGRTLNLERLAAMSTAAEQADALSEFVLETFRSLHRTPPAIGPNT